MALYNAFLNAGERTVTAAAASFIVNCVPILTAILATLFLGERLSIAGWIGSVIGLAGIAMIGWSQPGGLRFGASASLVLAAAIAQAAYFVLQRPLVRRYGALNSTAYTMIAAALLLAPWLTGAIRELSAAGTASATFASVIALAVIPAAIGYVTWSAALDHYGAARAANLLYLVPPVATLLGIILTGELPAATTILGGGVAILGVMIVNQWGRDNSRSQPRQQAYRPRAGSMGISN